MFWVQLLRFLLTAAVMGLLAHIIGEALPRRWFRAEAFPYRAYAWEQNGKFYQKLGIRAWKDRLPDMSRLMPDMVKKKLAAKGKDVSKIGSGCGHDCMNCSVGDCAEKEEQ